MPPSITSWAITNLKNFQELKLNMKYSLTTKQSTDKSVTEVIGKSLNTWKLNKSLLCNLWVKEKVPRKNKKASN